MLKFFSRLIFSFFSNFVALLAASYFIKGFEITSDPINFSLVAGVFTLINIFIKPILKFILSPVIVLTFGLGVVLVNALTLYFLDFFMANIAVSGLKPLFYATLIISLINLLIGFSAKRIYKE